MEQKIVFREMLSEVKALADSRGNQLTVQEIDEFFANTHLEKEQMELVYEYLKSQMIHVVGYEKVNKKASAIIAGEEQEPEEKPAEEEEKERWGGIELYLEELEQIEKIDAKEELLLFQKASSGDTNAKNKLIELYLPMVCELAGEFEGEEYLVEDLIQEGNIGLMMAVDRLEESDSLAAYQAQLMNGVNQYMQDILKEQNDFQAMGKGIAQKVNHLSEAIRNLEEDLEHKVSVEELSAYLEMPLEEIRDILKMAGDELEVEDYDKQ